jgi:aldehyde:ferredoxin oxidoreductase
MGAKMLKAVAISGGGKTAVADSARYRAARKAVNAGVVAGDDWRKRRMAFGTTTSMPNLQEFGMLPTRNWSRGSFEGYDKVAPVVCRDQWDVQNHPCAAHCPAPCAETYRVTAGEYAGISTEGPDYETIYAFGTNCGIDRLDAVIALEDLADELGLDTISAGVTLSFIMECFERGMLSESETAGFSISFGDHANALKALRMIASRSGLGHLMAEGTRRSAAQIGQNSEAFAMQAQGLELGGWGCRASFGQALAYAVSPRGGCHHDLGLPAKVEWGMPEATEPTGRGALVLHTAPIRIIHDSAIQCSFSGLYYGQDVLAELLASILGREIPVADLTKTGLRILNLERLVNVREGVSRATDRLPDRLLKEALPDGPRSGSTVPLETLKDDFYRLAGWDPLTGIPTRETLKELGLDEDKVVMNAFSDYVHS